MEQKAFTNDDDDDKQIIETKEEEIESPEPGGPVLDPAYTQSAIDNRQFYQTPLSSGQAALLPQNLLLINNDQRNASQIQMKSQGGASALSGIDN